MRTQNASENWVFGETIQGTQGAQLPSQVVHHRRGTKGIAMIQDEAGGSPKGRKRFKEGRPPKQNPSKTDRDSASSQKAWP